MKHDLDNFDITKNIYDIMYIHTPKTGGGTVHHTLKKLSKNNDFNFKECHNHHSSKHININPHLLYNNDPYNIYIISIRNPIKRFISAFYHNFLHVDKKKHDKIGITCINTFLDKLFINGYINKEIEEKFIIGHLKFGFYEYLYHFLEVAHYNNIIVLLTDNLDEELSKKIHIDKKQIFRGQEHSFKPNNTAIDEKHIYNLKNYLKKEYLILEKIKKLKLITSEEYDNIIE